MYKTFIITIFLAAMCLVACKQREMKQSREIGVVSSVQKEYVRTDDSKRLAYWFPEKDSINHDLVLAAEPLWMLGRENDDADIFDYDYQMQWQQECEKSLVHCFDSIYPNSRLSLYEKTDSMVNVISRFFAEDADETTMGMIINLDLENSFLTYKIASMSKEVLDYEKSFDTEIRKWNELHKRMNEYCCGVVHLDWFGGSGAVPVSIATRNIICRDRIADLQNILDYLKKGIFPSSWSIESAMYHFQNALKETAGKVTSTDRMKEMDLFYDKESETTYDSIYHQVLDTQPLLLKTAKDWIEIRKGLLTAKKSPKQEFPYDRITSVMLERLAKTISESSEG